MIDSPLPTPDIEQLSGLIRLVMLVGFCIILAVFLIAGIVLKYHWRKYGVREEYMKRVIKYFHIISAVLFSVMILSILAYYIV